MLRDVATADFVPSLPHFVSRRDPAGCWHRDTERRLGRRLHRCGTGLLFRGERTFPVGIAVLLSQMTRKLLSFLTATVLDEAPRKRSITENYITFC